MDRTTELINELRKNVKEYQEVVASFVALTKNVQVGINPKFITVTEQGR